ncbi:MAG: GntR family transcriptional regulator [Burkholderiales bacterium]|nr:GntR family transcriptional regulator [Ferrovum sp.]
MSDSLVERRGTLPGKAYALIEEAIVTMRILPGSVVSEKGLSDVMGIGRTPIREAIQRLAREHLIVVLPQRGLLVAEIDPGRQLKLLEARREIERLICRAAAKRATTVERQRFAELAIEFDQEAKTSDQLAFVRSDREFNELSLVAARNEYAAGAMRQLHGLSRRFWYYHDRTAVDRPKIAQLHRAICLAIADGDVETAGASLDRLIDYIEEYTRAAVFSKL